MFRLPSSENDTLNAVAEYPEIAKKMSAQLLSWLKSVDAKYPVKDSLYNEKKRTTYLKNMKTNKLNSLEKNRMKVLDKGFQPNKNWWKSKTTKD